ncbi:hypothetical protein Tco_0364011 [Tanacetum coccineum]
MSGTVPPIPPPLGTNPDHEGPSNTRDTKIASLRLKFNAFKALECEKVQGTFTRLKILQNDHETKGVSIPQAKVNATFVNSLPTKWLSMNQTQRANNSIKNDNLATLFRKYNYEEGLIDQIYESETIRFNIQASSSKALISNTRFQDSDSNVEEDTRSNSEFLADLNAEFHDKALLANQKRFYKGLEELDQPRNLWISLTKPVLLGDDKSVSSKDEGITRVTAFMAILEDELFIGKGSSSRKVPKIPKPFILCKYCGFNNHHSDEFEYYPRCDIYGSIAHEIVDCVKNSSSHNKKPRIANQYLKESGPKVVFRDNSSGDTEGYGSVNCNGITFTRVLYVNDLKHNLISISQLCDANSKVLFTKTQGTIFNKNNKVVLISPRRRDVYVIDMSSYNEVRVKELRSDNGTESIIIKRHGKIAYDVLRGRCPDISYFYVFGYPMHIHNHRDHLGKFDEKAGEGFFLGYSLVAKAFRVFNIRRKEMEESHHVTFSKDDEEITQSSIEGDEINFNENKSFLDNEFLIPKAQAKMITFLIEGEPLPKNISPSAEVFINLPIPQDRWSREKHIDLVNILGEPQPGVTTRSRIRDSETASTHECLYVNFLSETKPKKLIEALEEEVGLL